MDAALPGFEDMVGPLPLVRPSSLVSRPNLQATCEHDWQIHDEKIQLDTDFHDLVGGHTAYYHGSRAHFKVKECIKCGRKHYLDFFSDARSR